MKISDLGVLELATDPRMSLGDAVPYFFYRYVTLFAVADSMGARAKKALAEAGHKIGKEMVNGMFYRTFDDLVEHYRQHGLGLLALEEQDDGGYRVRLGQCATCQGLPNVGMALCYFDGGILAGALEGMFGQQSPVPYRAEEVECAGLGNVTCVFDIRPREEQPE